MVGAEVLRGRAAAVTPEFFLVLTLGTAVLGGAEVFLRVETVVGRFSRLPPKMVLWGEGNEHHSSSPIISVMILPTFTKSTY